MQDPLHNVFLCEQRRSQWMSGEGEEPAGPQSLEVSRTAPRSPRVRVQPAHGSPTEVGGPEIKPPPQSSMLQ